MAEERGPIFYTSPNVSQSVSQLSEDEQIMIAQKIGLIQHLPTGKYDGKKNTECVICMEEFVFDDCVRYLPCLSYQMHRCLANAEIYLSVLHGASGCGTYENVGKPILNKE